MMGENAPVFGKRHPLPERRPLSPPTPILHAPNGFGDDPPPRKRSWAVSVGVAGLLLLGAHETYSWRRCAQADPAHLQATPASYCYAYSAHRGWAGSAAGERNLAFGGFGHAASGHGGGG
jgi:hypothetical protein